MDVLYSSHKPCNTPTLHCKYERTCDIWPQQRPLLWRRPLGPRWQRRPPFLMIIWTELQNSSWYVNIGRVCYTVSHVSECSSIVVYGITCMETASLYKHKWPLYLYHVWWQSMFLLSCIRFSRISYVDSARCRICHCNIVQHLWTCYTLPTNHVTPQHYTVSMNVLAIYDHSNDHCYDAGH